MHAPPVIAIVGATASGKTAIALELAARLGAEIVSADSMQMYRGVEIGSAAPTPAERARVRHHFVGCLDPGQRLPAGAYAREARAVLADLAARGIPAVIVGGSGLYVEAVLDGLFAGPGRDAALRAQLIAEADALGNEALMERLRHVDPAYAATLSSPNDRVRVVRALEVHALTGQPYSQWHRAHQAAADPLGAPQFAVHFPERAALYARIERRVDAMLAAGWVDEVRRLIEAGHGAWLDEVKALGYREIAAHLHGAQTLDAAVEATKKHHRNFAKRQLSWFRNDPRVRWIDFTEEADPIYFADRILLEALCP